MPPPPPTLRKRSLKPVVGADRPGAPGGPQNTGALLVIGCYGVYLFPYQRANNLRRGLAGEKYLNDKYTTLIRQGAALGLSAHEREITAPVKRSLSNEAIAKKMNISARTVQNHLAHIYVKTNTHSRSELARL